MFPTIGQRLVPRLRRGLDLSVEFATLGEYRLGGPVEVPETASPVEMWPFPARSRLASEEAPPRRVPVGGRPDRGCRLDPCRRAGVGLVEVGGAPEARRSGRRKSVRARSRRAHAAR